MTISETRIYLRGFVCGLLTNMEIDEEKQLIWELVYSKGSDEIRFETSYNIGFKSFLEQDCGDIVKSVKPTIHQDWLAYPFTNLEKLKKEIELKLIEIQDYEIL